MIDHGVFRTELALATNLDANLSLPTLPRCHALSFLRSFEATLCPSFASTSLGVTMPACLSALELP